MVKEGKIIKSTIKKIAAMFLLLLCCFSLCIMAAPILSDSDKAAPLVLASNGSSQQSADILRQYEELLIPGIMYHKVTDNPSDWTDFTLSSQQLKEDFAMIAKLGFTPITFAEYEEMVNQYNKLKRGDTSSIDKASQLLEQFPHPIFITVDDGYKGIYENFLPLMKQYRFKANFFVFGEAIDDHLPEYVTWEQVREIQQSGLALIGNHTYKLHEMPVKPLMELYKTKLAEAQADIAKNRTLVEQATGGPCNVLSYPYGKTTPQLNEAMKTQYSTIVTTEFRCNRITDGTQRIGRMNRPAKNTSFGFFLELKNMMKRSTSASIWNRNYAYLDQKLTGNDVIYENEAQSNSSLAKKYTKKFRRIYGRRHPVYGKK